jgi:hypothetical protein
MLGQQQNRGQSLFAESDTSARIYLIVLIAAQHRVNRGGHMELRD